jgi:hypothetical protein
VFLEISFRRFALWTIVPAAGRGCVVEEVQSGAGRAGDRLILVFRRGLVIVQPLLDLHQCCRAGEKGNEPSTIYDSSVTSDHDIAQGSQGGRFVFGSRPATPEPAAETLTSGLARLVKGHSAPARGQHQARLKL